MRQVFNVARRVGVCEVLSPTDRVRYPKIDNRRVRARDLVFPARGGEKMTRINPAFFRAVDERTFRRKAGAFEPHPRTGRPRDPSTIDSFLVGSHRRVRFAELADYLARNNNYERNHA